MRQQTLLRVLAASATISVLAITPAGDAQVGLERKTVLQQDLKMPGYETIVMSASSTALPRTRAVTAIEAEE